jgi:RNA polymerase sigma-70 factor (ECF subfamily)
MENTDTTLVVQQYLDELAGIDGDTPVEPIIRVLLDRAVRRLQLLCSALLHHSYPRLVRSPLNLETDEVLASVVERLLKALREARPQNVRQFFALANQHIRWELNDLARRLDKESHATLLNEGMIAAPESSGATLTPNAVRMLDEIERLPEEEREVFTLVRIQGMNQTDVGKLLHVSAKTVQRRLNRGLLLLTEKLVDLQPPTGGPDDATHHRASAGAGA